MHFHVRLFVSIHFAVSISPLKVWLYSTLRPSHCNVEMWDFLCSRVIISPYSDWASLCKIQIAYKLSRLALVENWPDFNSMFTICSFKMNQVHILFFSIIPFSSSLHKSEVDYDITVNSIFTLNNINWFKTFYHCWHKYLTTLLYTLPLYTSN